MQHEPGCDRYSYCTRGGCGSVHHGPGSSRNTREKCWAVIRGTVYDLSAWVGKHTGGDKNSLKLCGSDGTSASEGRHGGQRNPEHVLVGFAIGTL